MMNNVMKVLKYIGFVVILVAINLTLNLFFSEYYGCANLKVFIFSTIILMLLCSFLTAIFKKTMLSVTILSSIFFILIIINYFKMNFLGEPIWLTDIHMINNLGEVGNLIKYDILSGNFIKYILILILVITYFIISVKLLKIDVYDKKKRITLFLVSIILLVLILIPYDSKNEWILKNIYEVENRADNKLNIMGIGYYKNYGIIGGIYGQLLESKISEPLGYDEENVNKILNSTYPESDKNIGKPNIILMFAESFWEVDKIKEIEFDKKITPNFEKLKDEGIYLELITPSYGGASANVEFEVLTGGNMRYLKNGYIPFTHLYRNDNSNKMLSIVNELSKNNYRTKMVFGNDAYLSKTSYLNLGMDEYLNLREDYDDYEKYIKGYQLSDEKLVDFLVEELENKNSDEKLFYSMATIGSHGPFTVDKYDKYDFDIIKTELNEEDTLRLKSYAQGMYDVDKEINRIYEYIQNYDENTIFIVLGDHLPSIVNTKGEDVLAKTTYFNTNDTIENHKRKYTVPCLILANYDIEIKIPNIIGTDMLLTTIVNNMDIDISNYYKWLYSTINEYPAGNRYISINEEGKTYKTNEINNKMQQIYKLREQIQYKLLNNP